MHQQPTQVSCQSICAMCFDFWAKKHVFIKYMYVSISQQNNGKLGREKNNLQADKWMRMILGAWNLDFQTSTPWLFR